jgi:hypothetical protein
MKSISPKQAELFEALEKCGEMVFACGPRGISANLVGQFVVKKNHLGDDQLDVDDGTHHVHVDWLRVKRVELSDFHGEGLLTFFDGTDALLKLYRMEGPFPKVIESFVGNLIDQPIPNL